MRPRTGDALRARLPWKELGNAAPKFAWTAALTLVLLALTPRNAAPVAMPPSIAEFDDLKVAVHYVALQPPEADKLPVRDETKASLEQNVRLALQGMTRIWSQCKIRFELEEVTAASAAKAGVLYRPKNRTDLHAIRRAFRVDNAALFVATGKWDRTGTLGNDGSNAFSSIPDGGLQGIVFENWIGSTLLSHEFGHLSGDLDHLTGKEDLMNHIVSPRNTRLSPSECLTARTSLLETYPEWLR